MYDFDEIIPRRGSNCIKWDARPPFGADGDGIIPLWVADMDFKAAPCIIDALRRRVEHGVFGYVSVPDSYYEAIIRWFGKRHGWKIEKDWIIYTTGVVPALSAVIKALCKPGDKVILQTPVYNCFFSSIRNNGCEVLESVLLYTPLSNSFEVDWQDFEAKCADEKTTVFLLCNPHNPTGRVWTKAELLRMNDICLKHGVRVVSDEIHCELTMPGHRFQPFAACSEQCRQNSVVLNSPTKAFNIAGLQIANIICSQPEWRRRIDRAININEVCDVNPFGPVALKAAYNESEEWLDALNRYLWDNYTALCDFCARNLPQWHVCSLEGTYLPWIDITATGMTAQQYADRLMQKARVWVNPGTMYGPTSGEGYIRLNIACQRSRLTEALQRIADCR